MREKIFGPFVKVAWVREIFVPHSRRGPGDVCRNAWWTNIGLWIHLCQSVWSATVDVVMQGWAVTGDEKHAISVEMHQAMLLVCSGLVYWVYLLLTAVSAQSNPCFLREVYWRDVMVPDTCFQDAFSPELWSQVPLSLCPFIRYTFRIMDATSDFHQHWLSFKASISKVCHSISAKVFLIVCFFLPVSLSITFASVDG